MIRVAGDSAPSVKSLDPALRCFADFRRMLFDELIGEGIDNELGDRRDRVGGCGKDIAFGIAESTHKAVFDCRQRMRVDLHALGFEREAVLVN